MKKAKLVISILCLISLLFSISSTAVLAATSFTGYEEGDGWINENPNAPTDYAYSIAVIGDTQTLVARHFNEGYDTMSTLYDWIVDNKESKNIQYVLGMGDICENNLDTATHDEEWAYAKGNITKLDGVVPYLLNRGAGHDVTSKFNANFASHEYYIENLSGTYAVGEIQNAYTVFTAGSTKYLALALDYGANDDILAWASGIIEENSDCKVIITTHAYLNSNGERQCKGDGSVLPSNLNADNNDGEDMWQELVSKHKNIFLVLCGHNMSNNIVWRKDLGDNNNVVTQMLVNPQGFDNTSNGDPKGMVCMLYFSEDGSIMDVEWISTVREQYYKETNQFTVKLDEMSDESGNVATKYGVIPAKYTDSDSYPFLAFQDGKFLDLGDVTYDMFIDATGCMGRKLRNITTGGEITVIARRDFTVSSGAEMVTNHWPLPITVDLCGYTVDATAADHLLSSTGTNASNNCVTLKNGTLLLTNALMTVSTHANVSGKVQTFNFEDLDITATHKNLIVYNTYANPGTVNVNFKDCDITASSATALSGNVFRAGKGSSDANNNILANLTVKGGSLTFVKFDQSVFVQELNGGSVTFLPNDRGEMTRIVAPLADSVTNTVYNGADSADLYLVKNSVTGTTAEYVMASLDTPYGTIPYSLSSLVDYPFIAFVNDEIIGSANIFIDESGCLERALRNKNTGDGVTIILRRDFVVPKKGFLYTNYQKGLFLLDLMGHTVDATQYGDTENLFSSNGTQSIDNSLWVKNGTLKLAKALLSVSTHKNAPGKTQSFTFENLNITAPWSHLAFHNTSASAGNVNINYINCNITSDNLASGIFQAGKSATDTNFVTHVTVKGGSVTLKKLDTAKYVIEHNGGTVTFLKGDNGEYTVLRVLNANAIASSYDVDYSTDVGVLDLIRFGVEGGYGVYLLRDEAKLVKPKVSLTMHSSFVLNVYVPANGFITSITLGGLAYDVAALPVKVIDSVSYHHVEREIGVAEAADAITLVVKSAVQEQRWSVGVISYAGSLINGNYTEVEKTLARDILAYVRASYVYADNEDTAAAVAEIDAIIGKDYTVDPDTSVEVKQTTEGLSGAALYLGNAPAFVFYPELDGEGTPKYDLESYVFSVNGAKATTSVATVNEKTAIFVYTYAYAITDTVTYTVEGTDITGEYNLAAYLVYAEGAESESVVALVKALWQYSDAAKAYKAQELS